MDKQVIYSLLKMIRGDRTQKELSLSLNKSEKTFHLWEVGHKNIKVSDFDQLCRISGIDFKKILKNSLNLLEVGTFKSDTVNMIKTSWNLPEEMFLEKSGMSKSKWWRLLNEDKDLALIDLLTVIRFHTEASDVFFEKLGLSEHMKSKRNLLLSFYKEYEILPFFAAAIFLQEVKDAPFKVKKR